jgi:phosphoglycolate phosphatase-like HAD superfamily hydrolase
VRARLAAIAARAGLPLNGEDGVLALLEAARSRGPSTAVEEMETVLGAAELAGASRCDVNTALLGWLERDAAAAELSILSLNSPAAVRSALARAGLDGRVAWAFGRGDVTPKPSPAGLELLLARHGIGREETLFVGDSGGDRACAQAAGVRFRHVAEVGVRWRSPGPSAAAA